MSCTFSIKRPLQVSIARKQTKVNCVKLPWNLFFFPSNTNRFRFRPLFRQLLTTVNRSNLSFFQQLTRWLYLFIYLVNYISPSKTIHNRVQKFVGTYNEIHQDFAHILPNLQSSVSKYPLWPLTKLPNSWSHSTGTFPTRSGHRPVPQIKSQTHSKGEFTKRWPGH